MAEREALTDLGMLPVHSVDTEEMAHKILVLACATNPDGDFIAQELVEEQTLMNLRAFGSRLQKAEERIIYREKHLNIDAERHRTKGDE